MPALLDQPAARETHDPHSNGFNPRFADAPPGPPASDPAAGPTIDELVTDYIMLSLPLPSLAARHRMSLPALCDMLDSPPVKELISRLTRHAARRARVVAVHTRACALSTLETTAATTDNPETARKACVTLTRASDRVLYPTPRRRTHPAPPAPEDSETPGPDVEQPAQPEGAQKPHPTPGAEPDLDSAAAAAHTMSGSIAPGPHSVPAPAPESAPESPVAPKAPRHGPPPRRSSSAAG